MRVDIAVLRLVRNYADKSQEFLWRPSCVIATSAGVKLFFNDVYLNPLDDGKEEDKLFSQDRWHDYESARNARFFNLFSDGDGRFPSLFKITVAGTTTWSYRF